MKYRYRTFTSIAILRYIEYRTGTSLCLHMHSVYVCVNICSMCRPVGQCTLPTKTLVSMDAPCVNVCFLRRPLCQWMLHVSMYASYEDSCVNGCSMCQCMLPTKTVVSMDAPCVNVCSLQRQLCQCMLHAQVIVSMHAPYTHHCVNVCSLQRQLWVIFSTWQQFRKKLPLKKITRRANLSTVMAMCRCSDM